MPSAPPPAPSFEKSVAGDQFWERNGDPDGGGIRTDAAEAAVTSHTTHTAHVGHAAAHSVYVLRGAVLLIFIDPL